MRYLAALLVLLPFSAFAQTFDHPNVLAIENEIASALTVITTDQTEHKNTSNRYLSAQLAATPDDCTTTKTINWTQPVGQVDDVTVQVEVEALVRCNFSMDGTFRDNGERGWHLHCTCWWNGDRWRWTEYTGEGPSTMPTKQWYIYEE